MATVSTPKRQMHKQDRLKDEENDADDNADKLFVPGHPLSILVIVAGKGELAGGTPDDGGFLPAFLSKRLIVVFMIQKWRPLEKRFSYMRMIKRVIRVGLLPAPTAKHNEQGRCVQTVKFKIDPSN